MIGKGIGIIIAVVVVGMEGIRTTMRDMVRIVVIMGMGGRLVNGGDDCELLFSYLFSISFDRIVFCCFNAHIFLS